MQSDPKAKILLVDDRPENLIALEAMLKGLGQLVKAYSGEEALRCLLNQDFAVILLDVQMPGLNGFDTANLIRQRERSRYTPIIFLTAYDTNDTAAFTGYSLGAVDYLMKPINPVILTSKVAVFVELFKKTLEIERQATQLAAINTELRRSEERFRSLSACSPLGIFLTDTAGCCTYTNPACQAICSFSIEGNWQEGWARCIHPEDYERVYADWYYHNRGGWAYSAEFRIYGLEGAIGWVQVRTAPILSELGQLLGHVGTIEDITERKEADAIREQIIREQAARQQAEAANQMKDEFLMVVSHELRTPLNAIQGFAQLLLMRKTDRESTMRALETIHRNAKFQAQLIEDILDVSRLTQGKLRLSMQPVNLQTLINSILETIHPLTDTKSIRLEASLTSTPQIVSGDPERLRQIILNLLSNAVKFTPQGGQVEVRLEQIERIGNSEREIEDSHTLHLVSYAQITVTDTGIGIQPNFLPYVFDRFRQADSSTTRTSGGLGLGLAIVSHLVKLHNGKIDAYSDGRNKGATFTVQLPLATTSATVQPNQQQEIEGENSERSRLPRLDGVQVLVVEDHTDTRDFITLMLEQSGASVTAVASVNEAIQSLEVLRPQVLVSDIGLPEADGYELIREVKEFEVQQGVAIPAIALTAYTRHEDCLQAIAAGFQIHLPKPVDPDTLVTTVAELAVPLKTTLKNSVVAEEEN